MRKQLILSDIFTFDITETDVLKYAVAEQFGIELCIDHRFAARSTDRLSSLPDIDTNLSNRPLR